jgi:hypothetical protein
MDSFPTTFFSRVTTALDYVLTSFPEHKNYLSHIHMDIFIMSLVMRAGNGLRNIFSPQCHAWKSMAHLPPSLSLSILANDLLCVAVIFLF